MSRPFSGRPAPRPLADFVDICLAPALAAQGFAGADILAAWPEIVGDRLARYTQPIKVEWPRRVRGVEPGRRSEPATLLVRVEGAFAVEMQHLAPLVIERINAHYGWRCVGKLVLKQGPVRRPATRRKAAAEFAPAARARIEEAVSRVEEDELRAALDRLGTAVAAGRER